jgi:serine/threonine protein kinase/tetratricopeptide (TPR) repeat protein
MPSHLLASPMRGDPTSSLIDTAAAASRTIVRVDAPRVLGAYRIVGTLGRGGMAVVHLAEHAETGARVAIKTVESRDASLLSGIRREIHALRRVDHPGVVRIVAEGLEGDLPWYAMEVVEGRTLRDYNDDLAGGRISTAMMATGIVGSAAPIDAESRRYTRAACGALPRVLTLLRSVCDALAFVHGMGLVHRDLKPENILIRDDGSPVLVDFGLAMQLRGPRGRDVLEMGDRFIGTPAYMAPEQIDGELMDARVDLYALGCILYESVTGSAPFVGSVDEVLDQHLRASPERPSIRVSEVPPALDELILTLLQKRPRDRTGHADEVAALLVKLGAEDAPRRQRIEPYLYRPRLAGRASALAVVEEKLKTLRVAHGGRVLVGGESGVGKTRFAIEVGISANRRGFNIVTGQCVSVAASDGGSDSVADSAPDSAPDSGADVKAASLHPFRHLLSTIVDHCRAQGPEETARIFGPRGPALALHEPSIAGLPGQDLQPPLVALPAPDARARLNACLAAVVAAYATPQPLMLVIEDLQWADEASMSFLQSLDPAYFAASRVLIVGTYRSEETSPELRALRAAADVTRIDLGRLDRVAVQRMVSDMLAMPDPPAALIQFLAEQSEGHPFFVAEYLRIAVQERMLVRNDAREWQVDRAAVRDRLGYEALPVPGELRALVLRRVAALGPGALAVARMAAILGRETATDVLAAAMSLDEAAHFEAVEELRARQIVDIEGDRLRFAHDKLRKVIHGEIAAGERRRLHAAAGAAIEARYAGTPALRQFYPELVHHFTSARAHEKAFEYLMKAGQAALDATAAGEALGFFRRAVALDDASAEGGAAPLGQLERAILESQMGNAAVSVGLLPEAERLTRSALHRFRGEAVKTRASSLGVVANLVAQLVPQAMLLLGVRPEAPVDPRERQRLLGGAQAAQRLTEIHFLHQDWVRGLGTALETVNLAGQLGTPLELVRGYATLGFGLSTVELPRLRALYEARAREAAIALGDPQGLGHVALLAGVLALMDGRFAEARTELGVALARGRDAQDARIIALCLSLISQIATFTGRLEEGISILEQVSEVGRKSGNHQSQTWALGGQGWCLLALGQGEKAVARFEQRRTLAEDYRHDPTERITHGVIADAYCFLGDRARARQAAEDTLRRIQDLRVVGFQFYMGYVATGETLFSLWERATAPGDRAELARSARRMCEKMQQYARVYRVGRPQALRFQGLLDARDGRLARARDAFREAAAEARRLGMPLEEGIAHHELGRHAANGDPAREAELATARTIFAGIGHRQWLDRVEQVIASPRPPVDRRAAREP